MNKSKNILIPVRDDADVYKFFKEIKECLRKKNK